MSKHALLIYNTETRQKEEIKPLDGKKLRMYTCGPTVYDYAHIGNFRTYVFEDILRRTLKLFGNAVEQVMNITDVDDKTIRGANAKGVSLKEYVEPYTKAFFEDLKTLNIERAEHYPKATDYIEEMIKMISELLKQNVAYVGADESVYFSIAKFESYGRLSHLNLDDLQKGASKRVVANDEYDKESAADFVLWKSYDEKRDGSLFWDSPFGRGRPGWHIECSAMAMKILGDTIDIHCGGVDNIFPHHENEIAQSECISNQRFANHWVHSEHLLVDRKKMSKSAKNFYTLRDLLDKGFVGREVRYILMQTHYRQQLNFTMDGLRAARSSLQRIDAFIERLSSLSSTNSKVHLDAELEKTENAFFTSLADDLNISSALACLFDLIRDLHALMDENKIGKAEADKVLSLLKKMDVVLGVLFNKEQVDIPEDILDALKKRNEARKSKNWSLSDELRDYITSKGFQIEDTPKGAKVTKNCNN